MPNGSPHQQQQSPLRTRTCTMLLMSGWPERQSCPASSTCSISTSLAT